MARLVCSSLGVFNSASEDVGPSLKLGQLGRVGLRESTCCSACCSIWGVSGTVRGRTANNSGAMPLQPTAEFSSVEFQTRVIARRLSKEEIGYYGMQK
eukprot:scaffold9897_cov78-Phaeocystis_antarctica.AAC.2